MKKFIAFTLAETLIVMGVIGVVAALTLPNLNNSTNNKEKIAKLRKIYSNLNDAYGRAIGVYGPAEDWLSTCANNQERSKKFGDRLTEFMKLSQAGVNSSHEGGADGTYKFVTADGATVQFKFNVAIGSWTTSIVVDIDGDNKGKNSDCIDIFKFKYNVNNGIYPTGQGTANDTAYNSNACTAWVIENDNMDYTKCASSLKWGTATTCK